MKSATLLLLLATVACADDGMWLFNQFPTDAVNYTTAAPIEVIEPLPSSGEPSPPEPEGPPESENLQ